MCIRDRIRVVTQNQVSQIFKNNNDFILNIVEDALRKWANDDAKLPDKISQIFDQNTQNRINCMPATIIPDKVSGMKWVSVFPANAPKMCIRDRPICLICRRRKYLSH